jgi:biotin operon repressor
MALGRRGVLMPPEEKPWPAHARAAVFSQTQLYLDIMTSLSTLLKRDADAIWILLCVSYQTMLPFADRLAEDQDLARIPAVPETERGSVSRRMIAEKTGLARETVRRRVEALVAEGVLIEDEQGRVRSASMNVWSQSAMLFALAEIDAAVQRYNSATADFARPLSRRPE